MKPETQLARHIAERDTDTDEALIEFAPAVEQRYPIIQNGQNLAAAQHRLSQLLIDGDWTRIKLEREALATMTAESAAALREFGA